MKMESTEKMETQEPQNSLEDEGGDQGQGQAPEEEEEMEGPSPHSELERRETEQNIILENGNNNFPAIWSEEGKYLASVLGDALVKGLSLVSSRRPTDPVEYLANFLKTYKDGEEMEEGVKEENSEMIGIPAPALLKEASQYNEEDVTPKNEEEESSRPEVEENEGEDDKMEGGNEEEENEKASGAVESTPEVETAEMSELPAPEPEHILNEELTEGYDKLEDALDEEEASTSPFDPEKEEQAEKALLESAQRSGEATEGDGDPFNGAISMQSSTRDDNGQSVLHFACTRPGGGSTIMAFLQNPSVNLAWRDVNMRTARDVAEHLQRIENVRVVDNWILQLASNGEKETLQSLLLDGYDHLADLEDSGGVHIVEVSESAEHREVALLLRGIPEFKEKVDRVHRCVRSGDIDGVKSLVGEDKRVAVTLNPKTGRTAMHVAVLCEEVAIVKWLSEFVPECVKRGDNLERTCLHYAMGVDKVEKIVRILVRAGAKRVVKDLRDRQPSWYFINRDEIAQLQADERAILN